MGIFSSRSQMKQMGKQEGFNVFGLEDRLYLFIPETGTDRVIISAHGGREKNTNAFQVPDDVVLRFYSDDKNTVLDPGFSNFYSREAAPKEILTETDKCYDYTLSKYQGSHNKMGETYGSIAKALSGAAKTKANLLKSAETAKSDKSKNLFLNKANQEKMAAVLTVRNRLFRSDISLSYAISQVKAVAPHIVIFDCLFCRWLSGGKDDAVPLIHRS